MTLAQHHSLSAEHFTPAAFVKAARETMGRIDLDPASCGLAQSVVGADTWYGPGSPFGENGLEQAWSGRIFLNPPGGICDETGRPVYNAIKATKTKPGRPSCRESGACGLPPGHEHRGVTSSMLFWWKRLLIEYGRQPITQPQSMQAIFVAFNLEFLRGTMPECFNFPFCIPFNRIAYDKEVDGRRVKSSQPPHASILFYIPSLQSSRRDLFFPRTEGEVRSLFARAFSNLGICYAATRL